MNEDPVITFIADDFAPAFDLAGIDLDSVTEYEWRKFEDAFLAGTRWDEVAQHAAAVVASLRQMDDDGSSRAGN